MQTTSSAVPRTDTSSGNESDDDIHLNVESLEMRMFRLLVSNNLEIVFPNRDCIPNLFKFDDLELLW